VRAVTVGSVATGAAVADHPIVARRRLPVVRVPFGVDPDRFGPRTRVVQPVFVHVADMNPVKDQSTMIVSLALLAREFGDVELHWVGDGPCCGDLRRLARALNVDRRIHWWGRVPHTAITTAYGRAAAFVLSSRHEAQGVVLAEAASAGLPIATTAVGIAHELPSSGAHVVRARDPHALAQAMRAALLTDEPSRRRLQDAAGARFGIAVVDRRLDAVYRRVISSASVRRTSSLRWSGP
jgi:glycosyltransferase involved in cell wall biosynthesis